MNKDGYRRLWEHKFGEVPLSANAADSWSQMQHLLDQKLPATKTGTPAAGKFSFWFPGIVVITIITGAVLFFNSGHERSPVKKSSKLQKATAKDTSLINNAVNPAGTVPGADTHDSTGDFYKDGSKMVTSEALVKERQAPTPVEKGKVTSLTSASAGEGRQQVFRQGNSQLFKPGPGAAKNSTRKSSVRAPGSLTKEIAPLISAKPRLVGTGDRQSVQPGRISPAPVQSLPAVFFQAPRIASAGITPYLAMIYPNISAGSSPDNQLPAKADSTRLKKSKYSKKLSYGLTAAWNVPEKSPAIGGFVDLDLGDRLSFSFEPAYHISRSLSGSYTRASYTLPDSLPPFRMAASAKFSAITSPLSLRYRLTGGLYLQAGLLIDLPLKQRNVQNSLSSVPDRRDTLSNSAAIRTALAKPVVKLAPGFGITAGAGYSLRRLSINAFYRKPLGRYILGSDLGSFSTSYQYFELGARVRLNGLFRKR